MSHSTLWQNKYTFVITVLKLNDVLMSFSRTNHYNCKVKDYSTRQLSPAFQIVKIFAKTLSLKCLHRYWFCLNRVQIYLIFWQNIIILKKISDLQRIQWTLLIGEYLKTRTFDCWDFILTLSSSDMATSYGSDIRLLPNLWIVWEGCSGLSKPRSVEIESPVVVLLIVPRARAPVMKSNGKCQVRKFQWLTENYQIE